MKKDECTPHGVITEHSVSCWTKKINEITNIQMSLDAMTENIRNLKRKMKAYGIDRMKDYDDFISFLKYNKKELQKHKKALEKKITKAQDACEHEWEPNGLPGQFICRKCKKETFIIDIETRGFDGSYYNIGDIKID